MKVNHEASHFLLLRFPPIPRSGGGGGGVESPARDMLYLVGNPFVSASRRATI